MSQPYVGEIRMFGGNFPPNGWAFCNGQTVAISQNDTLFNLIGTTYGGDGQQTFGLPDLQGRLPIHQGSGPGLSTYVIGQKAGVETVTLTTQQIPSHTHPMAASTALAPSPDPTNNIPAQPVALNLYFSDIAGSALAAQAVLPAGGSQPHDNMMPYACISFIISLYGIYPSQN